MRRVSLLLILFLSCPIALIAQVHSVSGTVRDGNGQMVSYANVFLLRPSDSTLLKGTSANEKGQFVLNEVSPGTYLLKASYIGNASRAIGIDVLRDVKIGALIIDQNIEVLQEVVVTSKQPVIERKADRLVFNVENTVVSQGSSWEVLQRTPGVITVQEELQVRNQQAVVYINDRRSRLATDELKDLLENYPGQYIKSVEIINNPPARYDAEGGPVINIVTSKNISLGYKGNVNGSYTQAVFPKYTLGTSHFYKTEKLNIFTSYSTGPRKDFKGLENQINFIDSDGVFSRWDTDFDRISEVTTHNALLNVDYSFDSRNEISFAGSFLKSPDKSFDNFQRTEIRSATQVLDSTFTTRSDLLENQDNFSGDLTYTHNFKNYGNFKLNGHYTRFSLDRTQDAQSDYFDPQGQFMRRFSFFTDAEQTVKIYTAQADLTSTLGTVNLETGIKGSFIDSQSGQEYFDIDNDVPIPNPGLSDDYLYDENVYAAYLDLSKDWEKWSVKSGLRAEHTQSSGFSRTLSEINNLEYFELFPSLYVLYTANENHSFAFDYSRKVNRPRYEDLNPFRYFINENNFIEGNPELIPSFSHNFNVNYTLKGEFFFDVYYRDNGRYISTLSFQDNENLILRDVTQNVLESTSYGFDFNYGKSVLDWWYLYSYISIFHEDETFVALESDNQIVVNEVDGFYIDLTNYLTLSKDGTFKGELGLTYLSGFLQGSYQQDESTLLTLGLRKSFWEKRMLLSLQFNDILNKFNSRVTSRYLNQDNSYFARPETQYVRLGLTINFGNFRLEDNQREIDKMERDRLAPK
ncbi:outer membrane beta-barrel protein [Ulvibacterium marinum]|uniref:outer membrane beta-barrel protein n=1 Tax=Ulvibacterium marinum TaxID=2419782 RepID=UPI0024940A00|nr:outer membrane beta-barrel protein [Ulvibacterium marinum]